MHRRATPAGRLLRTVVMLHAAALLLGAVLPLTGRTFPGVAGYFFTWDMFPGYATENGRWIILARFSDGQWSDLSSSAMLQYREHSFVSRVPGDEAAVAPLAKANATLATENAAAEAMADNVVVSPAAPLPVTPPFVDFTRADVDRIGHSLPILARNLANSAAQRSGSNWTELLIVQRYRRSKFNFPPDAFARRFNDRWSPGWRSRVVFRETNPQVHAAQTAANAPRAAIDSARPVIEPAQPAVPQ